MQQPSSAGRRSDHVGLPQMPLRGRGISPGFDDVWEINATTAESHLLPSVGLPNSWLHFFLKDNKSVPNFQQEKQCEQINSYSNRSKAP